MIADLALQLVLVILTKRATAAFSPGSFQSFIELRYGNANCSGDPLYSICYDTNECSKLEPCGSGTTKYVIDQNLNITMLIYPGWEYKRFCTGEASISWSQTNGSCVDDGGDGLLYLVQSQPCKSQEQSHLRNPVYCPFESQESSKNKNGNDPKTALENKRRRGNSSGGLNKSSNRTTYTISGLSAGGFMAVQYHVAYSSEVHGAGIVAGGPYFAAQDSEYLAVQLLTNPNLISVSELVEITRLTAVDGFIDSVDNLQASQVFLYSGTLDSVVLPGVVQKLEEYYANFLDQSKGGNLATQYSIPSEHAWITKAYGNPCQFLGTPYFNACQYDLAGSLLAVLLTNINPAAEANQTRLFKLDQSKFVPAPWTLYASGLAPNAYAYIPESCETMGGCQLHVSFHGCHQSYEEIGTVYILQTGLNEYAETNNIAILYPQVEAHPISNPNACFDWWGYTGPDYASQLGVQMYTIHAMATTLLESLALEQLSSILS